MKSFQYKTTPFTHQRAICEASWADEYVGLLLEQRTGKSKIVIDTCAHLHDTGRINGLLVIAPNGVHRNWINDEIPTQLLLFLRALIIIHRCNDARSERGETR